VANPEKKNFLNKIPLAPLCAAVLLAGFGAGYIAGNLVTMGMVRAEVATIRPVRENLPDYHFISPLLLYNFGEVKPYFEDKTLSAKIGNYIKAQYAGKNAQSISVSVRNFTANRWAGVNQDAQYQPGSMLKVIIMMAYFQEAELDPAILQKQLVYSSATDQETNSLSYDLPTKLVVGSSYSVEDLIRAMIADSDNGAETLLIDNVNRAILNQVYTDLSIPSPDNASSTYTISSGQYMDFLRILYNSTYLTEKYSEEALAIMGQSTYRDGISAGVPSSTTVAQKYGERVDAEGDAVQAVELHDCGIVYPQGTTYAICIMTKGSDIGKLTSIVKNISSLVYNYETGQ